MTVNLQILETLLGKLIEFFLKKLAKHLNNNSDNKTTSASTTINKSKTNNTVKIIGSNNTVNIIEIKNPSEIIPGWTSIGQDIQVHYGDSSEEFWLHIDLKGELTSKLPLINIGKYYEATVDTNHSKKIIFWIGAEVSLTPKEKIEYSVYLFITKELLEKQKLTPEAICKIKPDANKAFVIPIDDFSIDGKSDTELKDALEGKLQEFLGDIFKEKLDEK